MPGKHIKIIKQNAPRPKGNGAPDYSKYHSGLIKPNIIMKFENTKIKRNPKV
jgi:hypothetical protein